MIVVPSLDEMYKKEKPGGGNARRQAHAAESLAQVKRQRWRALLLVVKAKLEAIEAGISTLEHEFLANVVLPGGSTIGAELVPLMDAISQHGLRALPEHGE